MQCPQLGLPKINVALGMVADGVGNLLGKRASRNAPSRSSVQPGVCVSVCVCVRPLACIASVAINAAFGCAQQRAREGGGGQSASWGFGSTIWPLHELLG